MSKMVELKSRITTVSPAQVRERVFRLTVGDESPYRSLGYRSQKNYEGEKQDESDRQSEKLLLVGFIREPFNRMVIYAQRWNTLKFACFYASLEEETSIDEMRYYSWKRLFSSTTVPSLRYLCFSADFQGSVLDVRSFAEEFAELVEDRHNEYCHLVAEAVWERKMDGLFACSVRRQGGTCVAVYNEGALDAGEITSRVTFARGAESGEVEVKIEKIH